MSKTIHRAVTATAFLALALLPAPAEAQTGTGPTIRWHPERVVEGTLFTVYVEAVGPSVEGATGEFGGEPLHFREAGPGVLVALAAAPLDSLGPRRLEVRLATANRTEEVHTAEVPVARGDYRLERLTVAPQYGQPQPPEIQARIDAEYERAMAVARRSHQTPQLWRAPFVPPRDSRITSGFGHGREYNGEVQSRHTGTDFAGAVGAPVVAPARGIVALVDTFYLGGNVIYIDHGGGLVTGYLHLSAHEVKELDVVEPGQIIGRVGATGRVTGPHLHWIVRYGEHAVDGVSLLEYDPPF